MAAQNEVTASQEPHRFRNAEQLQRLLQPLLDYRSLGDAIQRFWLDPSHQTAESWLAHREINQVILANSLAPDTFLG